MARWVFAREDCFATNPQTGLPVKLVGGEAWAADDPFVKDRSDLFVSEPPNVRRTVAAAPVERATKAPGERRVVRREDA